MMAPDRYLVRRVVNDLVDALIDEGLSKADVLEIIGEMHESDMDYFDIGWLTKED